MAVCARALPHVQSAVDASLNRGGVMAVPMAGPTSGRLTCWIRGSTRRGPGLIGSNGAGKSTLLKVLSRSLGLRPGVWTLRPGTQSARSWYRFSSRVFGSRERLSERSDSRHEARRDCRKFDEIVAFSEVEKFIDSPVKHYSSGMYVRLAFAVAAISSPKSCWLTRSLRLAIAGSTKRRSTRCVSSTRKA